MIWDLKGIKSEERKFEVALIEWMKRVKNGWFWTVVLSNH